MFGSEPDLKMRVQNLSDPPLKCVAPKLQKWGHRNLSANIFEMKRDADKQKKTFKTKYPKLGLVSITCVQNLINFGPQTAEK